MTHSSKPDAVTCREAGLTSASSLRSGSASSALYQIARGSPTATRRRRSRTASASSASRSGVGDLFELTAAEPRLRFALPPAARRLDVLELRVHRRRPDAALGVPPAQRRYFIRFRNWILLANVIGLIGYVLVPTAPPRMFPTFGFPDTLANFGALNHGSGLVELAANPYAAMPSLHAADALIVGICMALVARHWWAKALWLLWPAWVWFAVMATGNHFWLDFLAGIVVAFIARLVVYRRPIMRRLQPARRQRPDAAASRGRQVRPTRPARGGSRRAR